jgi:hypothetical protein
VESASLSGTPTPPLSNRLHIQSKTILDGHLTAPQLEGVLPACAQHDLFLPDGARQGFLLGDGAGVGKGRQQAGIILHNFGHGRRKAVWFSVSADLIDDARRDLRDIGAGWIQCHDLREFRAGEDLSRMRALDEGILFCTYSLLVTGRTQEKSRLNQIMGYLGEGFDWVMSFDEIHRPRTSGWRRTSGGR